MSISDLRRTEGFFCLFGLKWLCFVSTVFRVYRRQNRPEEALNQCKKSLQLLKDCNQPEKTCAVYKDMAATEQDRGHLDRAIEHLTKAGNDTQTHKLFLNLSPYRDVVGNFCLAFGGT